jgi:YidC/Oxa1 family membrane protein insertase
MEKIVTVPFAWLLSFLYDLTGNYGVSMIIFAVLVQLVLLPITAKSKKSMMKMSRLQPRIQEIQQKYANDQAKQQEAIQALQKEEGASMGCGGCLWSLVPLLILFPLLNMIREPIVYLLGETPETAAEIIKVIKEASPSLFSNNNYYDQVVATQAIPQFAEQIKAAIPGISAETLAGINFNFLGLNLGSIPVFNVFGTEWVWNWAHIGLFLIPVISAGSQLLQTLISQKMNNSVITNEKGLQDKEAAEKSQSNQSMKVMMWMMPLMSLWIGFSVPASLSIYWFVGGVVRTVEDAFLTKHYRKIYDAEDAERLARYQAQLDAEAEKERIRAEKRAANPDGITQNTSKKKLQQKQRAEEAAAKAAAAKEYAAKKGIVIEEESEDDCLSGIKDRPFCKGRAYDPNRYSADSTEE